MDRPAGVAVSTTSLAAHHIVFYISQLVLSSPPCAHTFIIICFVRSHWLEPSNWIIVCELLIWLSSQYVQTCCVLGLILWSLWCFSWDRMNVKSTHSLTFESKKNRIFETLQMYYLLHTNYIGLDWFKCILTGWRNTVMLHFAT